jgi:GNAT superfamily N-acetyltransferase
MNQTAEPQVKVDVLYVGLDSAYLSKVMALHATKKSRLGQFPKGAFEDHARRKLILAAVAPNGMLAGYLLYRIAISKNRASIVHLTTADEFRSQGISRLLVERLKTETRHLAGISLSCRRDYDLGGLWRSLGFTVRLSKEGRGSDGALLDWWWFSHNQEDLFSYSSVSDSKLVAAIDANIFYDLTCSNRPQGEDTKVLQADWLQESIELCVTPEIYNEIHRSADEAEKKRARIAAQAFRELVTDEGGIRKLEDELKPWFNDAILDRDLSDLRQVAHAIAAEAPFFLTRDGPMLGRADAILETYGLRILHPTALVNHLDQLRREAEYRPARLEGSRWRERLVTATDIDSIVAQFKHPQKERARDFEKTVRHYLTLPKEWASRLIADESTVPSVFVVQGNNGAEQVQIPLLRHSGHPLAGTLLRHLLHELGRNGTAAHVHTISVTDPELSEICKAALEELGFVTDGVSWWKLSLNGVLPRGELAAFIEKALLPVQIKKYLSKPELLNPSVFDSNYISRLEHLFSPVKIVSPDTPSFVVSIRPDWAAHFFDIPVGGQVLMDLNEKLHLGIEGAYYCAATNTHVTAPSRILWYVSKGPRGTGSMSIKACSHLAETMIGTPKELFARFRHLGVYAWKHVLETAGAKDKKLMAFRFTRTERFIKEVPFSECQRLSIPQPVNPRRISDAQFAAIYRIGMNLQ